MDLDNLNVRQPYKTYLRPLCMDRCMHAYIHTYYPLLKKNQMTCTAWVQSFNIRDYGPGENIEILSKTHELLSTGRHLLSVSFTTSLKSNLCTALTTHNTNENKCIISHAKHPCASVQYIFKWNILAAGHKQGRVYFPHQNKCQGLIQTP
jgi:hypothetical protein